MPQELASEPGPEYVNSEKKGYQWYEMTVFARWDSSGKCQVLCIDVPFDFPTELHKSLQRRTTPLESRDPFAMSIDLWDQIIVYYDVAVWRVRDPVRLLEKVSQEVQPGQASNKPRLKTLPPFVSQ